MICDKFNDINTYANSFEVNKDIQSDIIFGAHYCEKPFFLIMIPTYKRADLIGEAIKSAINQTWQGDYEIIVTDNEPDMNVNDTLDVIKTINSEKVVYYRNKKNLKAAGNWNRAMELSRGKYIVMLHDDDMLHPEFLDVVYKFVSMKDFNGVLGVEYTKFTTLPVEYKNDMANIESIKYKIITPDDLFLGNHINISGAVFSKDCALKVGGFNDQFSPIFDLVFLYQISKIADIVKIKLNLAAYRITYSYCSNSENLANLLLCVKHFREGFTGAKFKIIKSNYLCNALLYYFAKGGAEYWQLKDIDFDTILSMLNIEPKHITLPRLMLAWCVIKFIKVYEKIFDSKSVRIGKYNK